jgi:hypothetical protein
MSKTKTYLRRSTTQGMFNVRELLKHCNKSCGMDIHPHICNRLSTREQLGVLMLNVTETWLYTRLGVDSAVPKRLFPIRKIPLELPYFPYQTNEKWFNTREEMCFHASLLMEASKNFYPSPPLFLISARIPRLRLVVI